MPEALLDAEAPNDTQALGLVGLPQGEPGAQPRHDVGAALLGLGAVLAWSSTFAVARSLAEAVGPFRSAALMLGIGGALGLVSASWRGGYFRALRVLPARYLAECGTLMVLYEVALFVAVGKAAHRQQVLEVGLLNYLWPSLTLLLSVLTLGVRVRPSFVLGLVAALLGATVAPLHRGDYSAALLRETLVRAPGPYALGLVAALSWALYTVRTRYWSAQVQVSTVPVFMVAAGLAMGGLVPWFDGPPRWSARAAGELAYMSIVAIWLAYDMWERAVRRGHPVVIGSLGNLAPVLSTTISSLYLGVALGRGVVVGCLLTLLGAWLCRHAVVDAPEGELPSS